MGDFDQGAAMGLAAYNQAAERKDARRREKAQEERSQRIDAREDQQFEETKRHNRFQEGQAELDGELKKMRKTQMAAEFEVESRMRKDEMERFVEAQDAYDKFSTGAKLIDKNDPMAAEQYKALLNDYSPSMIKHDKVAKRFETFDGLYKQADIFTAKKMNDMTALESAKVAAAEVARKYPDIYANPPRNKDGSIDTVKRQQMVEERREQDRQHDIDLRRATYDQRQVNLKAPELTTEAQQEMTEIRDQLKFVNDQLNGLEGKNLDEAAERKRDALLTRKLKLHRMRTVAAKKTVSAREPAQDSKTGGKGGESGIEGYSIEPLPDEE